MRPTLQSLKHSVLALLRRVAAALRRLLERLSGQAQPPAAPAPAPPPTPAPATPPRAASTPATTTTAEGLAGEAAATPLPPVAGETPPPADAPLSGRLPEPAAGVFTEGLFKHRQGDRFYRLFVPDHPQGGPMPLLVMLHGCKQNSADFAIGTQMNQLAREQGFVVLYPEQPKNANSLCCWNWFKRRHQQRDSGEPALLADLTRRVIQQHDIDTRRVYVAGLSAGGAMAAILGHVYADLFAAVGVHSGLPRGAAHDVASALAAMKDAGASDHPWARESFRPGAAKAAALLPLVPLVPTIVFHGDHDTTVHLRNSELVVQAALGDAASEPQGTTETGRSALGLQYTRSVYRDEVSGRSLVEHWVVHGVGHAWSGGNANGSFTDARGPDASREMLRFFAEHTLAAAHTGSEANAALNSAA